MPTEKRIRMVAVMVRLYCDCGGEIVSKRKGMYFDGEDPYWHLCTGCNAEYRDTPGIYPSIEYDEADEE